jgi:hypothetical protein
MVEKVLPVAVDSAVESANDGNHSFMGFEQLQHTAAISELILVTHDEGHMGGQMKFIVGSMDWWG